MSLLNQQNNKGKKKDNKKAAAATKGARSLSRVKNPKHPVLYPNRLIPAHKEVADHSHHEI